MSKYTIISTYPQHGSKNIGDHLITSSTASAIWSVKGTNVLIDYAFREDSWENVKHKILGSDAVIFACFAIRENLETTYPYLENLLSCQVPFGVVSAGTSLNMMDHPDNFMRRISVKSLYLMKQVCEKSIFFGTRDYLTQQFCIENGLKNLFFSGDIAFFNPACSHLNFSPRKKIERIAVSDPHCPSKFLRSFALLIKLLKNIFCNCEVVVFIHGRNDIIESYCHRSKTEFRKLYMNKDHGLDLYSDIDLHVGYRVHGHVSALTRRKPSYLLEQDGRGCGYGLTLNRKISVGSYNIDPRTNEASLIPVYQIVSLINQDYQDGFLSKFQGLEQQICIFSERCTSILQKLPERVQFF